MDEQQQEEEEEEQRPIIKITSKPPTFTCRWRTLDGVQHERSSHDEEEFKLYSYALYLDYINSKITDFEIRAEV